MHRALNISAAVAGATIAFSKPIFKIIDRLSEMDFLATYAGPVGRFLETGWGTLASMVIGAAIIGFSIYHGLRQRRAAPAVTATSPIETAVPAKRPTAKADEPESIFIPRINRTYIHLVSDEAALLELAYQNDVMILHVLTKLNSLTQGYVEDLVSILESLIGHNLPSSPSDKLNTLGQIRDLIILLKGNDVALYAEGHWKFLPERWEEPEIRDPLNMENQLILAVGPPPEWGETSIEVEVDNGQPRTLPYKPVFPTN